MNENEVFDISKVTKENVEEYVREGKLKFFYLDPENPQFFNRIAITPAALIDKETIDAEIYNLPYQGKKVGGYIIDMEYKEESIVPSKLIITYTVDGIEESRTIDVW